MKASGDGNSSKEKPRLFLSLPSYREEMSICAVQLVQSFTPRCFIHPEGSSAIGQVSRHRWFL